MIILTPDEPIRDDLDLLFLPGGLDVNPARQKGQLSLYTGNSNAMLEYFDEISLPGYIENGTPIFGVCRGAQSLYSIFGGKMNQHNYWHTQSSFPKDECHGLHWMQEEYFQEYDNLVNNVNSRHHQTMIYDGDNHEIEVVAVARTDFKNGSSEHHLDIVEVFKHSTLPIWGTQYHPEDCPTDGFTPLIIKNLLQNVNQEVEI